MIQVGRLLPANLDHREAEAEGLSSVQGQPEIRSETLSQNTQYDELNNDYPKSER